MVEKRRAGYRGATRRQAQKTPVRRPRTMDRHRSRRRPRGDNAAMSDWRTTGANWSAPDLQRCCVCASAPVAPLSLAAATGAAQRTRSPNEWSKGGFVALATGLGFAFPALLAADLLSLGLRAR